MKHGYVNVLTLLICVLWCAFSANARGLAGSTTFQVGSYGARADGRTDDSAAFMKAWKAACATSGDVKLVIPKGTYYVGPVKFTGPCKASWITIYQEGYLKASTDLSKYMSGDDWFEFGWVTGLTLTGGGTFDGQGSASWGKATCPKNKNCKVLPVSLKFVQMKNTWLNGVNSVNPKFFHMAVLDCHKFEAKYINIKAPGNSPNTDGMHIERSSDVAIYNAGIGTGDDCISIGHGNSNILLSGIKCGPGHGISVGSLGRYQNEGDVRGLVVRDSSITGTMNGVRIKTWENSPSSSVATNMTFQNIQMNNVGNPIIIDQNYCPYTYCNRQSPSRVSISNVYFKDIRGTSATPVAVTLKCSKGVPCQNVNLQNVKLSCVSGSKSTAVCANTYPRFTGTMLPANCNAL